MLAGDIAIIDANFVRFYEVRKAVKSFDAGFFVEATITAGAGALNGLVFPILDGGEIVTERRGAYTETSAFSSLVIEVRGMEEGG